MKKIYISAIISLALFSGCSTANKSLNTPKKQTTTTKVKTTSKAATKKINSNRSIIEQKQFDLVQSIIPATKIEDVKPSVISGIYEAYFKDGSLIYVIPDKRLLLMGEFYTNTGISLTNQAKQKYKSQNKVVSQLEQSINNLKPKTKKNQKYLKELLTNGIKVGTKQKHKYKIILLKSLSCPNCTDLDKYLETKEDVVTYIYLAPSNSAIELYSKKYNIKNPQEKLKIQGQLITKRLKGFGVPFALIIDDDFNLVDTIHGFEKIKWDKYIGADK